jgi:hypothetical protein
MHLPADALEMAGAGQDDPIPRTGLRESYPGECTFQRRENRKIQFAIRASASARGRIQPDLPGEVARWQPWRQSAPIANGDRLVLPDTLGTTIKLTSLATWRCPLAWPRPATASGTGAVAYIYGLPSWRAARSAAPVPGLTVSGPAPSGYTQPGGWVPGYAM